MKIFLSSTYKDLKDYRIKAAHAIERLGQQGVRMEVFGARPETAKKVCFDEIDSSDAFVGIYAHRYGFVPSGSVKSITEQEFDFASGKEIPIVCFLVNEDFAWLPKNIEQEPGFSKLKKFKQKISTNFVSDFFTTPEDLAYKVASSLGRFLVANRIKEELERDPRLESGSKEYGRNQVARRASRLQPLIRGARVLLVNDIPSEMVYVISILRDLGVHIDVVETTNLAISMLKENNYDAVISDMRRKNVPDEGINFLKKMRSLQVSTPLIFTVGQYEPERGTPAYAFGITNRVDELLNLLFDVFERVRG
jgi:CheY-like chemotaxis protein